MPTTESACAPKALHGKAVTEAALVAAVPDETIGPPTITAEEFWAIMELLSTRRGCALTELIETCEDGERVFRSQSRCERPQPAAILQSTTPFPMPPVTQTRPGLSFARPRRYTTRHQARAS
jgi:hypothetical protein